MVAAASGRLWLCYALLDKCDRHVDDGLHRVVQAAQTQLFQSLQMKPRLSMTHKPYLRQQSGCILPSKLAATLLVQIL